MVKRATNFKQVYLVDKHFLDFNKSYQYLPEKQHFDDFKVNKSIESNKYQTTLPLQSHQKSNDNYVSPANVNNNATQTNNFDGTLIPNEYFLNDSFTQTNGDLFEDKNTQTPYIENGAQNAQINDVHTQTEIYDEPYLEQEIISPQKSFICQLCNQIFANPKTFSNHLKSHKEQNKSSSEKSKTNSRSKERRSNQPYLKLNKNISSTKRFIDGRNIQDWKNQYLCNICNIKLRTYSSLKSHVNSLHRSRRIRYDFPNNSKYAAIASIDYNMVDTFPNNQETIKSSDIEMYEKSLLGNNIESNSIRKEGPLRIRNDIETSSLFGDNSNIMGAPNVRHDIGTQSNFEDSTNIMGPVSIRSDIGNSSGFENNSNIMGPLNIRNDMGTTSNLQDNSNIMGPINVRNELGSSSNFEDNSNVINTNSEKDGDEKESKDVTLVEDLQTYWCTKCEQFFRNFNSLKDHLYSKHNEVAILGKRSKTREKVKRKIPFYSNYKK